MKNERDELAAAIMEHPWLEDHEGLYTGLCPSCPDRQINGGHNSPSHAAHIADAVLAAGYRKPKQVTTTEELDTLPDGVAVVDAEGDVLTKHAHWWHSYETAPLMSRKVAKYSPLTVLYEPDPQP